MYLNATSLDNKLDEFKVVVDTYGPQIVAVSETWFKSISIVNVKGYNLYRKDRGDGRRGGGVCLYISESIDSFELSDAGFNLSKITDDELDLKEPFIGQTTLDLYEEEIEERSNKIGKSLKFIIHFKIILLILI